MTKSYVVIRDKPNEHEGSDWQIVRDKRSVLEAIDEAGYSPVTGDVLYVFEIGHSERFEATPVWRPQG